MNSLDEPPHHLADGVAPTKRPADALLDSLGQAFQQTIEAAVPLDTIDTLYTAIRGNSSDILRVYPVSQDEFKTISCEREKRGRKFRLFYLSSIKLLIVTIPSRTHETLQKFFGMLVERQIMNMGLELELIASGGGEYTKGSGHPLSGAGEGDGLYIPVDIRSDPARCWPTLVVEVGYSQSLPELRAKGQWWFYASDFDVKIVVLIKLLRDQGVITIEKWKVVAIPPRPGVVTRAHAASAAAGETRATHCVQTIRLDPPVYDQRLDQQAWTVTSGDLRLEFVDFFE